MRDYEQVKRELQEADAALVEAERTGAPADALRERSAALRSELYEHPEHPAETDAPETDRDGTYPERTP
jgi:hypothetical protein